MINHPYPNFGGALDKPPLKDLVEWLQFYLNEIHVINTIDLIKKDTKEEMYTNGLTAYELS